MQNINLDEKKVIADTLKNSADLAPLEEKLEEIVNKPEYKQLAKNLLEYSKLHELKKSTELSPADKIRKLKLKDELAEAIKSFNAA